MPQPRATRYEIARSVRPDFTAGCARQTTKQTYWLDGEAPVLDSAFYYLVRGLEPNGGSWGARSNGTERAVCP